MNISEGQAMSLLIMGLVGVISMIGFTAKHEGGKWKLWEIAWVAWWTLPPSVMVFVKAVFG